MHARLDNKQTKPNFSVTTCKPRYWIAFPEPENTALTATNPTDDSHEETKTTS